MHGKEGEGVEAAGRIQSDKCALRRPSRSNSFQNRRENRGNIAKAGLVYVDGVYYLYVNGESSAGVSRFKIVVDGPNLTNVPIARN